MRLPPLWRPGLVWLLVLGPLFFISYGWANHWAAAQAQVPSIVFAWERHVPLWPWTILPYWSIDFFYGLSLLICATRLELTRHGLRLLSAQLICVASFVLFPLHFSTPRPPVEGWAGQLFDALAGFDLPYNQAPSLHIVLLLILWDFYRQRLSGWAKGALHVWSALIGISVLTTYQHHFIDIPTGLLAGALCLWLWPLEGERPQWLWAASKRRRKLAAAYGAGALLLALLAGIDRPWWWLYWPAFSLALVALCYAAVGHGGLQKCANGRHTLASRMLLAPYRLGAWFNARCWTWRLPASVPLTERISLGRLPLPWEADHRRHSHIVSVATELATHHPGAHALGWLDLTEPSAEQLVQAAHALQQADQLAQQTPGGRVLLACALGFSRSAAVAATWLRLHGGCASTAEALARVRAARPQVVVGPALQQRIDEAIALALTVQPSQPATHHPSVAKAPLHPRHPRTP